jgi:predicted nucleotidyltransferase
VSFRSQAPRALHRFLLRTTTTPLLPAWRLAYTVIARIWAAYLARGEPGAATYVRGSLASGDALPGLSDVDVAVVLAPDPRGRGVAAARTAARWARLRRSVPGADLLLDYPLILERDELHEAAEESMLTLGLGPGVANGAAAYFGEQASQGRMRLLERPGLYSSTASWRRLTGPEARPHAPGPRDRELVRIAAWLELCAWWQWAFPACADPSGPRTASLCVKLISEPVRVWLWLAHGVTVPGRAAVLELGLERLPEERHAIELASTLQRSLARSPEPALQELLPATLRISSRIAALLAAEVQEAGVTEVALRGASDAEPDRGGAELILPHGRWRPTPALACGERPRNLPLCDWRTLADPALPDECFALLNGDPSDPAVLGAATSSQPAGPYPALRADGLLVLPSGRARARLRALKSELSDPVSFAVLEQRAVARFPNVRGFSAQDAAARGLAEHRVWLRTRPHADRDRSSDDEGAGGRELAMLLSAARVALFADSLRTPGAAELPLTLAATAAALGARSPGDLALAQDALGHYRAFAEHRTPPPARTLSEMRRLVEQLPGHA